MLKNPRVPLPAFETVLVVITLGLLAWRPGWVELGALTLSMGARAWRQYTADWAGIKAELATVRTIATRAANKAGLQLG